MEDVKISNMELFIDCIDESIELLYEFYHKPYFDLLELTIKNILAGEVLNDIEKEDVDRLQAVYDKIANVDFNVEDVRKAMQVVVLKCFKEMRISNWNTTPDTLGIFFSYFVQKFYKKDQKLNILDPLCGTGNLLLTLANYLENECNLFACDNDVYMTKLTGMTADLLSHNVEIYLNDTMNLNLYGMDVIAFDMPKSEAPTKEKEYFPYKAMLKYVEMLNEDGVLLGIVENDFFDYDKNKAFKEELLKTSSIVGIVELPDTMFNSIKPKIILVIQKRVVKDRKCFMVKLPSFTDVKLFNETLKQIEAWFNENYKNKEEN